GTESTLINGLQSVSGKVSQLAAFQTFTGNPNKIADLLKMYSSLTKADVMNAYQKYIKNKGAVILSVLPKAQQQVIAAADNFKIDSSKYNAPNYGYNGLQYVKAKDNFDRTQKPPLGPTPVIKAPLFWKKDLASGTKVIGAENTEIPVVTFSLFIPGGQLTEAKDLSKAGVASMFTDMMEEDTKNYTAEQFANELQKLGSSIRIFSGVDGITFSVQSLKSNFGKTMALLQERIKNPKFTQEAFDRLKKQNIESFKLQKSQPATIASQVFAKLNYGANNVLGINGNGTEQTVQNITLQDVQDYYNNYITTNGARVVVVGDVKEAEVMAQLAFLNTLPNKKLNLPDPAAALPVAKTKIYLVDIPKAAQTEFRVGYGTGIKYTPTGDYYATFLMNYPLGGDFSSRLNMYLRETKGWTYGANSRYSADRYAGNFVFSSGIRAASTDSALVDLMSYIKDYNKTGPTLAE
ncbi:MAG: insulinase family protein, partial [Sphingobacteriaceae bacterium]